MTGGLYKLRFGRTKDILSNLIIIYEEDNNTIENMDEVLEPANISIMEIIIRHK